MPKSVPLRSGTWLQSETEVVNGQHVYVGLDKIPSPNHSKTNKILNDGAKQSEVDINKSN